VQQTYIEECPPFNPATSRAYRKWSILTTGCPDKFLEPKIHGNAVFHFNKSDKVKPPKFDREAFAKKYKQDWEDCRRGSTCSTTSYRKKSTEATASKP
jgi:hypothetical protein